MIRFFLPLPFKRYKRKYPRTMSVKAIHHSSHRDLFLIRESGQIVRCSSFFNPFRVRTVKNRLLAVVPEKKKKKRSLISLYYLSSNKNIVRFELYIGIVRDIWTPYIYIHIYIVHPLVPMQFRFDWYRLLIPSSPSPYPELFWYLERPQM